MQNRRKRGVRIEPVTLNEQSRFSPYAVAAVCFIAAALGNTSIMLTAIIYVLLKEEQETQKIVIYALIPTTVLLVIYRAAALMMGERSIVGAVVLVLICIPLCVLPKLAMILNCVMLISQRKVLRVELVEPTIDKYFGFCSPDKKTDVSEGQTEKAEESQNAAVDITSIKHSAAVGDSSDLQTMRCGSVCPKCGGLIPVGTEWCPSCRLQYKQN